MRFLERFMGHGPQEAKEVSEFDKSKEAFYGVLDSKGKAMADIKAIEKTLAGGKVTQEHNPIKLEDKREEVKKLDLQVTEQCAEYLPLLREKRQDLSARGKKTNELDGEIRMVEERLRKDVEFLDGSISNLTQRYATQRHNLTGGHAAPGEGTMITEWEEQIGQMTAKRDRLKEVLDGRASVEEQAAREEKAA